jgi:hypothetical protein
MTTKKTTTKTIPKSKGMIVPKIIEHKNWIHESGAYPARIVLLEHYHLDGSVKEYSTHMEVNQNGKQAFYSGHYFDKYPEAKVDFNKRLIT